MIDLEIVIQNMLTQLPNFVGLILCVIYLWRDGNTKQATIDKLIDVIIRKENCDDVAND